VKFAYRFVHSREAAQDLAQDAFARVWERRESLHVYGDLRTYLLTVVRHRALDIIRHARVVDRAATASEPDERVQVVTMGVVPPTDVAAEEAVLMAAFRRVVAALPERQRSALMLRWEQGLSNREIARVLGIGEAAVSRLLSRTAEALMELV
jgi:RNA polymerase sigma-70 factor (ECF subfamily)